MNRRPIRLSSKIINRVARRGIMCLPATSKIMMTTAPTDRETVAGRQVPATKPTYNPRPDPPLGILSISTADEDHTAVRQSCSGMSCWIETAESCHTAFQRLSHGRISIVICERDLPDGTWRKILEHLWSAAERPFLIVTSRTADESLWAEVLNLGGYDVLAKPLQAKEVRHALQTAYLEKRHGSAHAGRRDRNSQFEAWAARGRLSIDQGMCHLRQVDQGEWLGQESPRR